MNLFHFFLALYKVFYQIRTEQTFVSINCRPECNKCNSTTKISSTLFAFYSPCRFFFVRVSALAIHEKNYNCNNYSKMKLKNKPKQNTTNNEHNCFTSNAGFVVVVAAVAAYTWLFFFCCCWIDSIEHRVHITFVVRQVLFCCIQFFSCFCCFICCSWKWRMKR